MHAFAAAVASISGLGWSQTSPYQLTTTAGAFAGVILLLLLILRAARGGTMATATWAGATGALALWTAAGLAYFPSREADQSRYQYYSAALVLLAVAASVDGWRPKRLSSAVLGCVAVLIVGSNVVVLDRRARFWRENSAFTAAEAGAMQIARDQTTSGFTPINLLTAAATGRNGLLSVSAGPYFETVDSYGSPADRPREILHRSEAAREAADLILGFAEQLRLQRISKIPVRGVACRVAVGGAELPQIVTGPSTLFVRNARGIPATLEVRRLAARYRFLEYGGISLDPHLPGLAEGAPLALSLPHDRSDLPCRIRVVGGHRVRLCVSELPNPQRAPRAPSGSR